MDPHPLAGPRYYFSSDRRLKFNFSKMHVKLRSWAAPLKFWFRTGLVHENSAGFYMQFTPSSRVGHALRLIFMLWLVKIWQVSSCGKCVQHLEFVFRSWSWQSFVSPTSHVFGCLFPLDLQNRCSCYQVSSVIHGWFVYWIYGWEMRRLSKLSQIQYGIVFVFHLWCVRRV